MRVLVALGGNALARSGDSGTWPEAVARMRATAPHLAQVVAEGHDLIVTHGNGPQVGFALRQNEVAEREIPPRPLHVLGAETQGQIGSLIGQELTPALVRRGVPRWVVTFVSRVEVSAKDPAFRHPTKPVGRYYSEAEARLLRKREGIEMVFDPARGGWRRVVASPAPIDWLEKDAVRQLLAAGGARHFVPVVAGGGGVPVVRRAGGRFDGVDAVIDKDRTAAVVAGVLEVEVLAIVTDVPGVAIGFRKPWEKWVSQLTVSELAAHRARGEFGEGSMAPKVDAALAFLRAGGKRTIIADIPSLGRALRGEAGTTIVND